MVKAVPVLAAAAPGGGGGCEHPKKAATPRVPMGSCSPAAPRLPLPLQGSAPWHRAGLWASECSSQKGTGGACLLRRQRGGVRKAARVRPAAICPRALRKGFSGPASTLISSKLLFALGPPAHLWGGVSCPPRPRGRPGPMVQVSPGCCCWRAPRAGPGGAGSLRLPPSQHGNNSSVRGRVVAAPVVGHA